MPLSAARARLGRPPFDFDLAAAGDDAVVRQFLREHPLPGRVSLTLEREPDARVAGAVEGDVHQTLLARDPRNGGVAGMASRSVRTRFVNGRPVRLGYLSQLRVAADVRGRLRPLVRDGFAALRALRGSDDVPAELISLTADNTAARRLLLHRRDDRGPAFVPAGKLTTYVLPAARRRSGVVATPDVDVSALADCLMRNLRRFQFAPVWDAPTLASAERMRGLSPADFVVERRGDRIAGCAALWDQRAFKQVVVRGYAPALARWRPMINLLAPWLRHPRLPAVGSPLEFAYVSHLAVDDDDAATADALVQRVRERAARAGLSHVVVGAPTGHPIAEAIEGLGRHERYETELFLVCWPCDEAVAASLDGRPPMPEVAIL